MMLDQSLKRSIVSETMYIDEDAKDDKKCQI